jgi:hypothetical protein
VSRARKWLESCNEHSSCNPGPSQLASRVIDVGDDPNSGVVKLREIEDGQQGLYLALSHCWGNLGHFVTTKATMEERKQGIEIADMPQTFQDAIAITRGLGLRYIWIDSLCICQDDLENWDRESAKMQAIYANAYLTLAADAARDNSEGLFPRPLGRQYTSVNYTSPEGIKGQTLAFASPLREEAINNDYVSMPKEALSDRAWSLQERVLSRRTLHYTTSQMYFECNEGFRGEDGLVLPDRYHSVHIQQVKDYASEESEEENSEAKPSSTSKKILKGVLRLNELKPREALLREWYALLWAYGPRKLTNASDKLPALSGLAQIFSQKLNDEYVAGLWRNSLIEGMFWQGLSCTRVSEYRAPSWSWASMDGIPGSGFIFPWKPLAEILDASVILKGTNPFGEITSGTIKLRAALEQVWLIEGFDPKGIPYENNPKIRTKNGPSEGDYSRLDFAFTAPTAREDALKLVKSLEGVDLFLLILAETYHPNSTIYNALIVRKTDDGEAMRRIGFMHTDDEFLGGPPKTVTEDSPIITLV